jgi:hypothetical protein
MSRARLGVVVAGCLIAGVSVGVLSNTEAEGPAQSATPVAAPSQSGVVSAAPVGAESARLMQENYTAIQKIANANRETNPTLKKIFQDMESQAKSYRSAVDDKVLSKDAEGAALVKKDKSLAASIETITKTLKEKQQERVVLMQKRSELLAKYAQNSDLQTLAKANAEAVRGLNDQLIRAVGEVSEDGKKLVDERARLQGTVAKPAVFK